MTKRHTVAPHSSLGAFDYIIIVDIYCNIKTSLPLDFAQFLFIFKDIEFVWTLLHGKARIFFKLRNVDLGNFGYTP